MIQRSILEWQSIGYGADNNTIPDLHAARLAAVARGSTFSGRGGEGVLEHRRNDLRARGVVGVIAARDCQLEILPKIEAMGEQDLPNPGILRQRLVHMLAVTHNLRIDTGPTARLGWQRDTLLEILIRIFCSKLIDVVRQGMPRRYIDHDEDLPALRGRLDVTRQFSVLAAQPQKLACRFDELSPYIALNQVMKATVTKLSKLSRSVDNQRHLRELGFVYADIKNVPPTVLRWDRIVLDRTNERWRELLSLARLLLGERYQQTSAGASDGHALLFEMNVLFEKYVAQLLKRALADTPFSVTTQGGHRDCLFDDTQGRFRTLPDIIIRRGNEIVLVIDTKWKRIAARIDDPKRGVKQSDIYQLMAYSQLYDCRRVMLLYPHHHGLSNEPIQQAYSVAVPAGQNELHISTIDVSAARSEVLVSLKTIVRDCLGVSS